MTQEKGVNGHFNVLKE